MNVAAEASLIVASSGLNLIKLLRSAMQDADASVASKNGGTPAAPPPAVAAPIVHASNSAPHQFAPIGGPRIVYQTMVYRTSPAAVEPSSQSCSPCDSGARPTHEKITLQAPWQIWPSPAPSIALDHFKRAAALPDNLSNGSFIDIFV